LDERTAVKSFISGCGTKKNVLRDFDMTVTVTHQDVLLSDNENEIGGTCKREQFE
jgi:hypothetical protein